MNFCFMQDGVRIGRDISDRKAKTEAEIIGKAVGILNGSGSWSRLFHPVPCRQGLPSCAIGLKNNITKEVYWHGNYQIEDARTEWNKGSLFLNKA